ncbi:MAG: hypothetical protein J5821_02935 [Alphaproteobacteria bacterium]|nr:hypothetical protein [Alphaproteobacteria bacterium]
MCLTRLCALLKRAGASLIPIEHDKLSCTACCFEEYELENLMESLIIESQKIICTSD